MKIIAAIETKTAIELIAEERQRQITDKGWTPEHDDAHVHGELSSAAMCYAGAEIFQVNGENISGRTPNGWPWDEKWNPSYDPIRNLVKAGALIVAEIERLQRVPEQQTLL